VFCDSQMVGDDQESSSCSCLKRWHVDNACLFPAPGGKPLWHVSRHPRNFRFITSRAETCINRRLPGTTHRFAALWPYWERIEKPQVNASRWVILGSRPLRHSLVGWSAEANIARWPATRQSGSPPDVGNKRAFVNVCQPFRARARWKGQPSFSLGRCANLSGLVTTKTSLIRPWLTFTETTENGFPCR